MQIRFTPTEMHREYRIMDNGKTFAFTKADVYTVPDELAAILLSKRPELFEEYDWRVHEKNIAQPEHNRMFKRPKKDK